MTEPERTTHDVVATIVRTAAQGVLDTRDAAIADVPDGVHQHRTAVRRVRSILAAFEPLLDEGAVHRIRVLYAQWGSELGIVRDAEVRAEVASDALRAGAIDDASVWRRLVDDEVAEYTLLHARLVELSTTPRVQLAERLLHELAADPPVRKGDRPAGKRLQRIARAEAHRVDRARHRSDGSLDALHGVRKSARRLRYVAEAIETAAPEILPDALAELTDAGEAVHDILGDHRDLTLFADRVTRMRALATRSGEPVEPYDLLLREGEVRARKLLRRLDDALGRIRDADTALHA